MNARSTIAMIAAAGLPTSTIDDEDYVEVGADAFVKPTDLDFGGTRITVNDINGAEMKLTAELQKPAPVVDLFNVGKSYAINPTVVDGDPQPIVRKVYNKTARRILRKRGGENRIGRKTREAQQQRAFARTQVDNSHEAARLLEAQRDYQAEQRAARKADGAPPPYFDGKTEVSE